MKIIAKPSVNYAAQQQKYQDFNYFDIAFMDLEGVGYIEEVLTDDHPVLLDFSNVDAKTAEFWMEYFRNFIDNPLYADQIVIIGAPESNNEEFAGFNKIPTVAVSGNPLKLFRDILSTGKNLRDKPEGKNFIFISGTKNTNSNRSIYELSFLGSVIECIKKLVTLSDTIFPADVEFILDDIPVLEAIEMLNEDSEVANKIAYILTEIPAATAVKDIRLTQFKEHTGLKYDYLYRRNYNSIFLKNVQAMQKLCDGLELGTKDFV